MISWEDELRDHFPGYLLPASMHKALPREAAERFLARLGGSVDAMALLLAASALSPVADQVRDFAKELPLAARAMTARTEVERVENEGYVRGRLDVPGTLRNRLAGNHGRVASRVREPHFNSPEDVLLVATADRLVGLLYGLEKRGVTTDEGKKGWAAGFGTCADTISHVLKSTKLRDVPRAPIDAFHEAAARNARHSAYGLAVLLHNAMKNVDSMTKAEIAQQVAEGGLAPPEPAKRFEIAVLIRLGRSIERVLENRGFTVTRGLVDAQRDHVFEFSRGRDSLRIYYDQVCFKKLGPRDRGMRHYFGERGRYRPDLTIEFLEGGKRTRAVVVEAKMSDDKGYLKTGYHEALLYRAEYADDLTGWPKAILVVSDNVAIGGMPRREDDVIAVGWENWVPDIVLNGLLGGA